MARPRVDLGATLEAFAALIGEEAAIRLSVRFGGRALYIPHRPAPDSPLVEAVGEVAALKLARRFGGIYHVVPLSVGKRARVIELRRRDWTVRRIAEELGCTERYVYYVLADHRAGGGDDTESSDHLQQDLFDL